IIAHFEGFAAVTADDAESRAIRADGYVRVGRMRYRLGELKEAEAAYADAIALLRRLAADFPARPEFRQDLAHTPNILGIVLRATGRLKDAQDTYATALTLRKQLVADFPNLWDLRNQVAGTYVNLANLCVQQRDFRRAKAYLAEAAPYHESALKANPRHPD